MVTCFARRLPALPTSIGRDSVAGGSEGRLQVGLGLLAAYRREALEEVVEGVAGLEVVDQSLYLHAGAGKEEFPAHYLPVAGDDLLRGIHRGPPPRTTTPELRSAP